MKTGSFIILTVLILYSFQVSHQTASQETSLASSQTWPEGNQPEEYKEEEKNEEETIRRPRGKRRRRLRKRPRAQQIDEVDRTNNPEQGPDNYYERSEGEEGVTPAEYPRRRPGKRRRRPYRRYQDDENGPPKPLRRRRKGGRKKIKPEFQEEIVQTEAPEEPIRNEENYEMETTTPLQKINVNINKNLTEEKIIPTTEQTTVKVYPPINQFKTKDLKDGKIISNAVKTDREDINDKNAPYGNKIFDRKKLFSNSRRMLPVTSAVIRKQNPTGKGNVSDFQNEQTDQLITEKSKLVMKTNFLPEPYAIPTEIIRPEKLIEELLKNKEKTDDIDNDTVEEEPNYPKILPKPFLKKNKDQETTTNALIEKTETIQTEKPTSNFDLLQNKTMEEEFEKMMDNLDLKSFNITNFNDYILELLKTKSGKEYLSKILEKRNMTLPQLLEHRERGSSQFHLFEIFPQKKSNEATTTKVTTSTLTTTTTSTTSSTRSPVLKETSNISFPSDDVMESFPKFMAGELEKHEQKTDKAFTESTSAGTRDNREPRLFESMPEFTTSMPSATKDEKPAWRVIPNPKFRPVSVRDETEGQIHKKYGLLSADSTKRDSFGSFKKIPVGVKSAIIISGIILAMATFGFLSLLISCRVRQKRTLLRAKQDLMCEHLQNEDFMASQQSLSPVLTKHQQVYSSHDAHHTHPNNRHYYLWRTLRRTFRYD